jgi:hypothetical protein
LYWRTSANQTCRMPVLRQYRNLYSKLTQKKGCWSLHRTITICFDRVKTTFAFILKKTRKSKQTTKKSANLSAILLTNYSEFRLNPHYLILILCLINILFCKMNVSFDWCYTNFEVRETMSEPNYELGIIYKCDCEIHDPMDHISV